MEKKRWDCTGLPEGWTMEEVTRKSGLSAGRSDVYYFSPSGEKIRSKSQLARYLGNQIDLRSFDFRTGKTLKVNKLSKKRWRMRYKNNNQNKGKPDLNTSLPAANFKQPVTKVTNHSNNKVKTEPQKAVDQPRQLFWEKKLRGLNAYDVAEELVKTRELPKGVQGVGPGCTDKTLLSAIASSPHTSAAPITGQLSSAVEKTPGVWFDTAQPLCKAFIVTDEDISSLFDFGEDLDLTSSQQHNLMYQLQTSYPSSQPQHQPQAPLPLMSYHTPSPYLTPDPPDSNPTSYLTFEPGGSSAGVETYSTGRHTYFQPQSTGHVLLQSAGHHGGTTVCQSYPWGNMYSQPTTHQKPQCPPLYPSSLVAAQDHQLASSTTLPPSLFFTRDGPSHTNPQHSSHTQTHTSSSTTTTVLPPVSTLLRPLLRTVTTQVSPFSPESSSVPPCVKIENNSCHSDFHCDFSPSHF